MCSSAFSGLFCSFPYIHIWRRHISNVPQTRGWEKKIADGPPCVVLASPGFMQVGPSRELFELWAPDARNGLIITGYSIEGTLARVSLVAYRGVFSIFLPCVYTVYCNGRVFLLSPLPVLVQREPLHITIIVTSSKCERELMHCFVALGHHDRTGRVHFAQGDDDTETYISGRNIVQCTCGLCTKFGVY